MAVNGCKFPTNDLESSLHCHSKVILMARNCVYYMLEMNYAFYNFGLQRALNWAETLALPVGLVLGHASSR